MARRRVRLINSDGRIIGQDHPRATLSDHDVDLIRELHEEHGVTSTMLARKFDVSAFWVRQIVSYRARVQVPSGSRVAGAKARRRGR